MPSRKSIIIASSLLLLGGGYWAYRMSPRAKKKKAVPPKVPSPKDILEGSEEPAACENLGPNYPGFEFDPVRQTCVPGPDTPTGIYIIDGCNDFILHSHPGAGGTEEPGPQTEDLTQLTQNAANASNAGEASADAIQLATQFFNKWWDGCSWPPSPDAPPRITALFMYITALIGQMVIDAGGKVYDFTDVGAFLNYLKDRFQEMGYPQYDENLVPDLVGGQSAGPYIAHGLMISGDCTNLQIDNLVNWLAWSRDWLKSRVTSYPDSTALTQALFATAFLGTPCQIDINTLMVDGVPISQYIPKADDIAFEAMRQGIPIAAVAGEPSPLEYASAALLNVKPPLHQPPAFAYKGFAIHLEEMPGGFWRWSAFEHGNEGQPPTFQDSKTTMEEALAESINIINANV